MNKLQEIANNKRLVILFFVIMAFLSTILHHRIFSLDIIGYHSWRQTQTQTVIENFANEDLNIFHPRLNDLRFPDRIYRMEFPLAQWLVAILIKLFGNPVLVSRIFFFLITLLSAIGIFKLVLTLYNNKLTALLTSWLFFFSPVLYYYSLNPMPDNLALCCCIWCSVYWFRYLKNENYFYLIISAIFLLMSIAVKLPFIVFCGLYLPLLFNLKKIKFILIPALIITPAILWYASVIGSWYDNPVTMGMQENNFSLRALSEIFAFNVFSTVPELLINYATVPVFILGFYSVSKKISLKDPFHLSFFSVSVLASFYFFYEINLIDKVHDYYLFPFLPLLFVIISYAVNDFGKKPKHYSILIVAAFMICPITAYLRSNSRWNKDTPGFTKEYLIYKKEIQKLIPVDAKIIVDDDESRSIILYHLQRKGWSYKENKLTEAEIKEKINLGALYLATDTKLDTVANIKPYLDSLIFNKEPVKLYKLKLP